MPAFQKPESPQSPCSAGPVHWVLATRGPFASSTKMNEQSQFHCPCHVMSPPCVHPFLLLLPDLIPGKEEGMGGDDREGDAGILEEDGFHGPQLQLF